MVEWRHRSAAALVVGVSDYRHKDVENLRYAHRDALAVGRLLRDPEVGCFPRKKVKVLTDRQARGDDLVNALSCWLPEEARGADIAFVFFAGHGRVGPVGKREEGYLLPHDADPGRLSASGIAMSHFAECIKAIDARAVVVCLDCCNAGRLIPLVLPELTGQGRILIASCGGDEVSLEAPGLRHGLFTYHLLRGLEGAGGLDRDGRVGVDELFKHVSAAVGRDAQKRFSTSQTPWKNSTDTGGIYLTTPPTDRSVGTGPRAAGVRALWRTKGAAAALAEAERLADSLGEAELFDVLRLVREKEEPAAAPLVFHLLAHKTNEGVRRRASAALQAIGWPKAAAAAIECAHSPDPKRHGWLLEGLHFREHTRDGVSLLDRLTDILQGDLRIRANDLYIRKRLALGLEETNALFEQHEIPYKLTSVLGGGLHTAAYRARDEENGLDLVVRLLLPEYAAQQDVRWAFRDLGKQAAKLEHHNLVLTYGLRELQGSRLLFVVRRYVNARTLQKWRVEKDRRFTIPEVIDVMRQILEALSEVHRNGLTHHGVKPSKIFLSDEMHVKLGSLSLPLQRRGDPRRLAYDYRYAAPETFCRDGVLDPAADQYALGCVAYELLCGAPPFLSDNPDELAAMHARDAVPPPEERCPELGPVGAGVVLRLLAREPGDRYAGVAAALAAVEAWRVWFQTRPAPKEGKPAEPRPVCERVSGAPGLVPRRDENPGSLRYHTMNSIVPAEGAPEETGQAEVEGSLPAGTPERVGRYRILGELGRGGMGVVYRARDDALERDVAIKMLSTYSGDGSVRARFLREAKAVAKLDHPNIVSIFDAGEENGRPYFAMPLVEGRPLKTGDPWPLRTAAALVEKVARAISYAHHRGVIHRDLKPSNIMLDHREEPLVMDFGLARLAEESQRQAEDGEALSRSNLTDPGVVMGTPAYMAPEQARGDQAAIGPATDVYGLGGLLYVLLTGRTPFLGQGVALILRLVNDEPRRPRELRPDIPASLEAICLRCLAKNPADRFAFADDLADALRAFLNSPIPPAQGDSDAGETVYPERP